MQHSIKDLWLYPFPEIDVVHTQEPLLPEPELTTPGRCIVSVVSAPSGRS